MHSVRISCQLLRSLSRKNSLTSQMKCFELNLTNIYKTKPGHKEELHLLWRIKEQIQVLDTSNLMHSRQERTQLLRKTEILALHCDGFV